MRNRWLEVALFVVILVGLFVWAGELVTRAAGSTGRSMIGEDVSVETGETLFWGPGKCHVCHAVGARGRSVRGPNLGASGEASAIAVRAEERARGRGEAGEPMSPTDYLVESLTHPSAYVVEGFKDEMPVVHEPPIALGPDELTAVVLYLQSLGGEPDPAAVRLPPEVRRRRARAAETAWEPYLDGDSARGRALFFDEAGPVACAKCHRVGDEGGEVGPELTAIAGTRTAQYIVESLVEPGETIAGGYETVAIETTDGRILDGVVRRETADSLWLVSATGEEHALAKADVARRRTQETSLMPDDLADNLSVRELHDLLAYLRTLR